MSTAVAFPKPKAMKRVTAEVKVYPDGREVCADTVAGKREYVARVARMVVRQKYRCCLQSYAPMCPGYLHPDYATFEHEGGRGHGGGKRDDRTELPDGTWLNGAAHADCNMWKASRFIDYNRGFQR